MTLGEGSGRAGAATRRSWRPADGDHRRCRPHPRGSRAFDELSARLEGTIDGGDPLLLLATAAALSDAYSPGTLNSNAAVLPKGCIETTEGTIANAALHIRRAPRSVRARARRPGLARRNDRGMCEFEPAAAVIDRYAYALVLSRRNPDRPGSAGARLDRRRQSRPRGVQRSLRAVISAARTPPSPRPSPTARTCASEYSPRPSGGRASVWDCCRAGCGDFAWIRGAPLSSAAWCPASRRRYPLVWGSGNDVIVRGSERRVGCRVMV